MLTNIKYTFRIYEDLKNATHVKIHLSSCGHYKKHLSTSTTKWHNASSLQAAESKARQISKKYGKGWRRAKCCIK